MTSEDQASLIRQLVVLFPLLCVAMSTGAALAFPGIMQPQILSPDSDIKVTKEQDSWIGPSMNFAGALGYITLPPIMEFFGRRPAQLTQSVLILVGWLCIVFAQNITTIYVGRIIQGIKAGGFIISLMILSEYITPSRRGYFQTLKLLAVKFAFLFSRIISLVCTWRQIAGIILVPSILGTVIPLFWPESPQYLAMKGKYEECKKSFMWLNPKSNNSLELKELILAQSEENSRREKKNYNILAIGKRLIEKSFLKSFFISNIQTLFYLSTFQVYTSIYITQVMGEVAHDKSLAIYISIANDFLVLLGTFLSCFIINSFKRRTILMLLGSLSMVIMFGISLSVFLKSKNMMNVWLVPLLVMLYNFVLHLGVFEVCLILLSEIYGVADRGLGSAVSGIILTASDALCLKLIPIAIEKIGLDATFAIGGVCGTINLVVLLMVIPETKDRTLQNIEDEMKGAKRSLVEGRPMIATDSV